MYTYEADLQDNDEPGITRYDAGYPIGAPVGHATDDTEDGIPRNPDSIVMWTELDYDIGGGTGQADRNAYVLGGFDMPDAHDFRGDHPLIPRAAVAGAYGDVGNSDDYPAEYAQGLAAQSYSDPTDEESWDSISQGL